MTLTLGMATAAMIMVFIITKNRGNIERVKDNVRMSVRLDLSLLESAAGLIENFEDIFTWNVNLRINNYVVECDERIILMPFIFCLLAILIE